jgi:aerobic carbon-monoxide dehydrogenase medium subunit
MKPAAFAYAAPGELDGALALLAQHGTDAKPLAGGQSLIPLLNLRVAQPALLVDLNRIRTLTGVGRQGAVLRIGAIARQLEIERTVGRDLALLALALRHVGHVATRSRGTIGGSLVHADPAGELPAVLLALGGEVVACSAARGERVIPASDFFITTMTTSLAEDELLTEVRLPLRGGAHYGFAELARRHGDFALAGAAAVAELDGDGAYAHVALALFGVADRPLRLPELESELIGRRVDDGGVVRDVRDAVSAYVSPRGDVHASRRYRKRVAGVLAARALAQAAPAVESSA